MLEHYGFTPEFLEARKIRTTPDGLTVIPCGSDEIRLDEDGNVLLGSSTNYHITDGMKGQRLILVCDPLDALAIDFVGYHVITVGPRPNADDASLLLDVLPARSLPKTVLFIVTDPTEEETALEYFRKFQAREIQIKIAHTDGARVVDLLQDGHLAALLENNCELWAEEEAARREKAKETAAEEKISKKETAAEEYRRTKSAAPLLRDFMARVREGKGLECISSGWRNLDKALGGGFYPGLYVLGAASGMGKTAAALQLAEQIATAGKDVLYFTLEMSAEELITRGISRHTLELAGDEQHAKNINEIALAGAYERCSERARNVIDAAEAEYFNYAERLFFVEGVGNVGAEQIRETVKKHLEATGRKPFVIVDYLQIMAPFDVRATDKQNTDKAVLELKRISRDYETPVLAISSFSRDKYDEQASMAAFKETGAIEYTADGAIIIQPQHTTESKTENKRLNKAMGKADLREIEFAVVKNRRGKARGTAPMIYRPEWHLMEEDDGNKEEMKLRRLLRSTGD